MLHSSSEHALDGLGDVRQWQQHFELEMLPYYKVNWLQSKVLLLEQLILKLNTKQPFLQPISSMQEVQPSLEPS